MFHSRAWTVALAARPGCRVVEMKTGHWVMLDAPQAFHAAVLDWLGEA
jgi:pimeloyl-ACP methyl ester carboxylesterase